MNKETFENNTKRIEKFLSHDVSGKYIRGGFRGKFIKSYKKIKSDLIKRSNSEDFEVNLSQSEKDDLHESLIRLKYMLAKNRHNDEFTNVLDSFMLLLYHWLSHANSSSIEEDYKNLIDLIKYREGISHLTTYNDVLANRLSQLRKRENKMINVAKSFSNKL